MKISLGLVDDDDDDDEDVDRSLKDSRGCSSNNGVSSSHDPGFPDPKHRSLISSTRGGIARLGKEPGQARGSGRGDQTMKTSTKGLHSVCGGGSAARRLSSSTRGRYASIRASGPVAVDVGSVVAPGANCRHSAGANKAAC